MSYDINHLTEQREDPTQHPHQQREPHAATIHQDSFGCDEDPTAHHCTDDEGHSRQQTNLSPEVHHLLVFLLLLVILFFPLHFFFFGVAANSI